MKPYTFDEFFASDFEESISPFITASSRSWGKHIPLKRALLAGALLSCAFFFNFVNLSLSYLWLSFVYFLVGIPAILSSFEDAKRFEINIDILMTLAAFVAIFIGSPLEGGLLLVLFQLSHALEESVAKRAGNTLYHLHRLSPKFATFIDSEGTLFEKSVREITVGDTIAVKNGEIIPLDGIILKGTSSLNLVHLTGENHPIAKTVGDTVPAGARNLEALLFIQVTKVSSESTLAQIIQLVADAEKTKPQLQTFLDRFGKYYASAIIVLTLLLGLTMPLFFTLPYLGFEGSIYRSLAFLIAASPCALIIATPIAYLSAISACAKKGILLKGGITLDALNHCQKVAFDKTGTLTTGELTCLDFSPLNRAQVSQGEALSIAYGLEQHVVHPIAKAIGLHAQEKHLAPKEISLLQVIPGNGIEGLFEGKIVAIGLPTYIESKAPLYIQEKIRAHLEQFQSQGHILALLFIDPDVFIFQFADHIRPGAKETIHEIKKNPSWEPIMLTGDHMLSAERVAKQLEIETFFANLRPEDKLEKVTSLSEKEGLVMVGDGINDAPALARATVGISMGKVGNSVAVDASDVILLNDDLHHLPWLLKKAHQTKQIVTQNLIVALGIILCISLPALFGLVPLWAAVVLHEGGTLLVGINSLRLLKDGAKSSLP